MSGLGGRVLGQEPRSIPLCTGRHCSDRGGQMKKSLLPGVAGALVVMMVAGPRLVFGAGTPANKAVASGGKVVVSAPGTDVTILAATLRTSNPVDLLLQVTAECSIFTSVVTDNNNATSTARGHIEVWVEFDGKTVPINSVSAPPQDPDAQPIGNDTDHVTFCDREYSRTVTDAENPPDGVDSISDYIRTKSAHAFNWIRLNAGAGVHTITVHATLSTATAGDATASAAIGNRMLVVE